MSTMLKTTKQLFKKAALFLVLLMAMEGAQAQQDQVIKDLVESLSENLPEDYDFSDLVDRLAYFRKNPIDLNNTSPEVLKSLVFLSPLQISNFFTHLKINGKLLDVLELQSINEFDLPVIEKLLPFITLNAPGVLQNVSFKNLISKGNNDLIVKYAQILETQKGFTDLPGSRYLGGPEKLLGKYRYTYSDLLSASLLFKKDAGEYLFAGNNKKSFDFMSFHIAFNHIGRIKKLILGDYNLQFGQGLTLWTGFGFGKGPDVTSVAKKDIGLKPYTSSNESAFLRGASATLKILDHLDFTPFISLRNLDASLSKSTDGEQTLVNLSISGLHRTATEIKNKKSQQQLVYGAALQYISNNLSVGVVTYQSSYNHNFVTGAQAYNRYSFIGEKLINTGLHYNYTYNNIYFYGEAASSFDGGQAFVNGAMASISKILSVVLVHRWYGVSYHGFFSQSIGENTEASNERGFYTGFNLMPNKHWSMALYTDFFKFPWLKYRINAPSAGYEILAQLSYTPTKTFKGIARFKTKLSAQNPDNKDAVSLLDNVNKENYRLKADWQLSRKLGFQSCLEAVQYKKGSVSAEIGYLIYQDIDYTLLKTKLSANLRLAWFNTPSYNSRVYAYEDDVLYGFSFGMYNGRGCRSYLNLRYRLGKQLNFWTRYAIFIYQNTTTVGSGLDQIMGNKKSEIKVQLRYEF